MPLPGIRFSDVRCVRATSTHIDIDNGVVESAGTSFSDTALVRVLGPRGWGIISVNNLDRLFEEGDWIGYLAEGLALARITEDPVSLAEPSRGEHKVPSPKKIPVPSASRRRPGSFRGLRKRQRSREYPRHGLLTSNGPKRSSTPTDSGYENRVTVTRSGFSVLAVAKKNGDAQMGRESRHTIHGLQPPAPGAHGREGR